MSAERRPSDADAGSSLPAPPPAPPRYDQRGAPPEPPRAYAPPAQVDAPTDIIMALVSAGLFLYVGFRGLYSQTGDALYDNSVTVFVWSARIIGFGILATAALGYLRISGAALLDLVIGASATALCVGVGAIWLQHQDTDGVLLLIFALVNAAATRGAWLRWRGTRGGEY